MKFVPVTEVIIMSLLANLNQTRFINMDGITVPLNHKIFIVNVGGGHGVMKMNNCHVRFWRRERIILMFNGEFKV